MVEKYGREKTTKAREVSENVVAILEDADRKLWVMTLDWDIGWLDYVQNPNSALDVGLRREAKRIRDALHYIMEGAATGDF